METPCGASRRKCAWCCLLLAVASAICFLYSLDPRPSVKVAVFLGSSVSLLLDFGLAVHLFRQHTTEATLACGVIVGGGALAGFCAWAAIVYRVVVEGWFRIVLF